MDVELLARLQFAFTVMFHYLFPPLSIGLGWLLVIMEGMYLKTGDKVYEQMARFWTKIFAVNFAMGVATGIVMEFEFGTNWAAYSRFVGDVFGSALAAEGIFAFFLESGFLAVLVFGWDRVKPGMHFFATLMVALGATFSAVWIVVANSWQQTPAGYTIRGEGLAARAEITDFWAMVFNPSSMHRLNHTLIGALIMGAFFVMSVMGYYIVRGRHQNLARKCFTIALFFGLAASFAALGSGHFQARKVAGTQPAKLAAFEGIYKSETGGTPLWLFGIPDSEAERVKLGLAVPGALSFLVYDNFTTPVRALDTFPKEDWPPVGLSFQSYHLMIAVGMFCIALSVLGAFYWWRGRLYQTPWLLWTFVFAVVAPVIGNQSGWVAAEVGRQPWIVYGLMRTSDALSESVSASQVAGSIVMFGFIYALLFLVWLYVMNDKIQNGPEPLPEHAPGGGLLDAASSLADHARGTSMTEAHEHDYERSTD